MDFVNLVLLICIAKAVHATVPGWAVALAICLFFAGIIIKALRDE